MAKVTKPTGKKTKAKAEQQEEQAVVHKPNSADLKFIGAAFDRTIEALVEVRTHARDRRAVQAKIDALTELKAKVRTHCPQDWFVPFIVD